MPRSISRVVLLCGLLVPAAAGGGCQRGSMWNLAPVEGTVTKGGRPLADIRVVFWADVEAGTQGPGTFGVTDAAGHYTLRTHAGDAGAAVGRYRVCLHVPQRGEDLFSEDLSPRANQPKDKPPALDVVQL